MTNITTKIQVGHIYRGCTVTEISGDDMIYTGADGRQHLTSIACAVADQIAEGCQALQGSEKQVAWAKDIRAEAAVAIAKFAAEIIKTRGESERNIAGINTIVSAFRAQTSAKWWIDNRNCTGEILAARLIGRA